MQEKTGATEIAPPAGERADAESSFRPGDTLAGRFMLHDKLGSGGSGTVFSALDTRVGDRVAVKILDRAAHDPANRERLRREIRATRSGHPNVVSIHELHEEDGVIFITMELVEGSSLRVALQDRERLILDDVIAIGGRIAAALDHLHSQGLVHRDVKPGNIMLSPDGAVKLCDMGLARPMAAGATVTETEMVVGTPDYMAPEMAREGELVAASDVYALGLTLYQCLTGEVPLAGSTAVDTLMARQHGRPGRVRVERPECPRWLDRLLDRMLDPDPDLRPSAAEVARAMDAGRFAWRPHRRHMKAAAMVFAAVVVGTVAVIFGLRQWGASPDPAEDPAANELMVTVDRFDSGIRFDIVDGRGRPVLTLTSNATRSPERDRFFRSRFVTFADLDGDGRRDVVFANPDHHAARQLEIHRRLLDGTFELASAWDLHHEHDYEGQAFSGFGPSDLRCADLDGDGTPEIVLVYNSSPYYLAEVLVFRPDGQEVLRVFHPGQIANLQTGDRDGDGIREIYVGATNNFHEQNEGNSSSPAFFAVETDWSKEGQILDLFGPARSMTSRVPAGMEVHYLSVANQQLVPSLTSWRYAVVGQVFDRGSSHFLLLHTDRVLWKGSTTLSYLRAFRFDRNLAVADAMWMVGPLRERGIDPPTADPAQMAVTYWNGSAWKPEVCTIPQGNEPNRKGVKHWGSDQLSAEPLAKFENLAAREVTPYMSP